MCYPCGEYYHRRGYPTENTHTHTHTHTHRKDNHAGIVSVVITTCSYTGDPCGMTYIQHKPPILQAAYIIECWNTELLQEKPLQVIDCDSGRAAHKLSRNLLQQHNKSNMNESQLSYYITVTCTLSFSVIELRGTRGLDELVESDMISPVRSYF